MLINYVQKVKLNLAEPYKMKPACEGGFFVFETIENMMGKNLSKVAKRV